MGRENYEWQDRRYLTHIYKFKLFLNQLYPTTCDTNTIITSQYNKKNRF